MSLESITEPAKDKQYIVFIKDETFMQINPKVLFVFIGKFNVQLVTYALQTEN